MKASFNKNRREIEIGFSKAIGAEYTAIILPCNSVSATFDDIALQASEKRLKLVISINTIYSWDDWVGSIEKSNKLGAELVIIVGKESKNKNEKLVHADQNSSILEVWFVLDEDLEVPKEFNSMNQRLLEKSRFYFPIIQGNDNSAERCRNIFDFGQEIKKISDFIVFSPPKFIDIYEPRIDSKLDLEPCINYVKRATLHQDPEISIIIPSYNSGIFLPHIVKQIFIYQTLERRQYEVIIVDDGSDDNSVQLTVDYAEAEDIELTIIHLRRRSARKSGDYGFRAGAARNAGVRIAKGRILLFLDSDMICPPNFLVAVLKELQSADVVQAYRSHLTTEASQRLPDYQDINPDTDCFVVDGGYWNDFFNYALSGNWNSLDHAYKYVCSNSLAISKELFKKTGWFKKTFPCYGFEDTELGHRLQSVGAQFRLLNCRLYHLEPAPERSEYQGDEEIRNQLLKVTASLFYQFLLDEAVYEHFNGMF